MHVVGDDQVVVGFAVRSEQCVEEIDEDNVLFGRQILFDQLVRLKESKIEQFFLGRRSEASVGQGFLLSSSTCSHALA